MSYAWNVTFFDAAGNSWKWLGEGEGFLSERGANAAASREMHRQRATGWRVWRRMVRDAG